MAPPLVPLSDRLARRVQHGAPDECWPWTGAVDSHGYGRMDRAGGGNIWTHRLAWELTHGPVPGGMFVCHRCDNPPCCNPSHLFIGSPTDNVRDMHAKGRYKRQGAFGDRNGSRVHPERLKRGDENGSRLYPERLKRGTENAASKLSPDMVVQIRDGLAKGQSLGALGRRFGVATNTIVGIRDRKTWAWLA